MKIKRNEPCPCGSGNKYKRCCMKEDNIKRLGTKKPELNMNLGKFFDLIKHFKIQYDIQPNQTLSYEDYVIDFQKKSKLNDERMEGLLSMKDEIKTIYDNGLMSHQLKECFEDIFFFPYHIFGNQYTSWFNEYYDFISEFNLCKKKGDVMLFRCMSEDEFNNLSNGVMSPSWTPQFTSTRTFKYSHVMIDKSKKSHIVGCVFDYDDVICEIDNDKSREFETIVRKGSVPKSIELVTTWGINDLKKMYGDKVENYLPIDPKVINNGFSCMDYINHVSDLNVKERTLDDVVREGLDSWEKRFMDDVMKVIHRLGKKFPQVMTEQTVNVTLEKVDGEIVSYIS